MATERRKRGMSVKSVPHQQIIQLIIAYTLAGAVVFTVVITCLSLVGWIKLADPSQQQKLFYALIVELVTMSVGFFSGFLKFDPGRVQNHIEQEALSEAERVRREQIADEAAKQYNYWMKHYNHPNNLTHNQELLNWLHHDRGALTVGRNYDIFKHMATRLEQMGYQTNPPPLETEFIEHVREYDRREEFKRSRH